MGQSRRGLIQECGRGGGLPATVHSPGEGMGGICPLDLCVGQRQGAHCGLGLCAQLPLPQEPYAGCAMSPATWRWEAHGIAGLLRQRQQGAEPQPAVGSPASAPYTNLGACAPHAPNDWPLRFLKSGRCSIPRMLDL